MLGENSRFKLLRWPDMHYIGYFKRCISMLTGPNTSTPIYLTKHSPSPKTGLESLLHNFQNTSMRPAKTPVCSNRNTFAPQPTFLTSGMMTNACQPTLRNLQHVQRPLKTTGPLCSVSSTISETNSSAKPPIRKRPLGPVAALQLDCGGTRAASCQKRKAGTTLGRRKKCPRRAALRGFAPCNEKHTCLNMHMPTYTEAGRLRCHRDIMCPWCVQKRILTVRPVHGHYRFSE